MTEIESTKSEIRSTKQIQMSGNETTDVPNNLIPPVVLEFLGFWVCLAAILFRISKFEFRIFALEQARITANERIPESRYWLRLIDPGQNATVQKSQANLIREATELTSIFGAILRKSE